MQCHFPHTMHRDGKNITVACRRCMPCRVNHAQDWSFRIKQELEYANTAHFITLTYSDQEIVRNDLGNGILVKSDLQRFFKRLRKQTWSLEQVIIKTLSFNEEVEFPKIKYYACGEYGGETFRPHYHAIIFNVPAEVLKNLNVIWKHGFVKIGTVTSGSISYVTKYITKVDSRDLDRLELTPQFNLMSKQLGISYVNDKSREYHTRKATMLHLKKKYETRIPKYYDAKFHDMENFETRTKINHYKALRSHAANRLQRKQDAELLEKGVYLGQYEFEQRQAQTDLIRKNNKRNKL